MAMVLLVLVAVSQLVVVQYSRGAMQAAVNRAARSGAAVEASTNRCVDVAHDVLGGKDGLLAGPIGTGVEIECSIDTSAPPRMVAREHLTVRTAPPLLFDVDLTVSSSAVIETVP